ncbi:TonB-dependent siderophore receptor [Gloeocapsopsis sp. IPPAS B-1203]|uniref:TonB-dependent siderophore receptor n=1 Tax=Gloeocapsopsis sp. IPPAS B-1203 TaxID=2049454 RepID=UPI000C18AC38|nr:TonB-dependent siderophore receptor [Gloeocapsopsis sp. IPPAS B-1203]PIG91349.1 TonB-dependent siderophore receptor [Gloeocapsopsis sp. IPPAS B-1203]
MAMSQVWVTVQCVLALSLLGAAINVEIPARAQEVPQLSEEQPATTVEASPVQITGVRVETTEAGLQVVLETASALEVPETRIVGNTLIAEIPNAAVEEFSQIDPIEGIALVRVTSLPDSQVQVAITGTDAPPAVEVRSLTPGLVLAVTLGEADTAEDDAIEILVTGEQEEGYRVPDASVGTRTDTPLRDIPQSIQVIPQQVLEEQQVTTLNEALRNAPGVIQTAPSYYNQFATFTIRGFEAADSTGNFTRNGFNYSFGGGVSGNFANIERIEVLRGPASVLFGRGNPGGTINIVTKQPLAEPFYSVEATIGSYNFYRGAIDLTGPLNDESTIRYRLNASYENADSFVDFLNRENPFLSSAFSFDLGRNTTLTLDAEYNKVNQNDDNALPAIGTVLPNVNGEIPRNRNSGEENTFYGPEVFRVGYNLEHRVNENWLLRNAFYYGHFYNRGRSTYFNRELDPDQRTIQRGTGDQDYKARAYELTTNIVGNFSTGSIQHQLLFGVDLSRLDNYLYKAQYREAAPLDLFNPVYGLSANGAILEESDSAGLTDSLGIYVQNQVTLTENLKLLVGGRFDAFEQTNRDFLNDTEEFQSGNAFSPRVGIVYQPIEPISLYASYSRSFAPSIGRSVDGEQFQPERGTQYEIGVKADINDRISATVALYDLTRSNVTTDDLSSPGFSIQTGEQNSRGIELNVAGEILPGWNMIAGYAYTDARITEDNTFEVGNRLNNVPEHSFNLWTSYELQQGELQGLGLGVGFFFVGDRQGDLDNSFILPSYFRTDAAIFYNRGQFRAALNFRNLFNVAYFESAYDDLNVFPAEPFTVQGTISWEF